MTVSNSWLVKVDVSINTNVTALPAFNNCAFVGVMPLPSEWAGAGYALYTSLADFTAIFTPKFTASVAAFDVLQANRYSWLINDVTAFFNQTPTPSQIYIFALAPTSSATDYVAAFNAYTASQNAFYGFHISDLIYADVYSVVIAQITVAASSTAVLIAGTTLTTSPVASPAYELLQPLTLVNSTLSAIVFNVPFYTSDATTVIPIASASAIVPAVGSVTTVGNTAASSNGITGYQTAVKGVEAGLLALRTANNQKKMFADFLDFNQSATIQDGGGSKDLTCFYHSMNLQNYTTTSPTLSAQLSAACMGEYFVNLFVANNGLTILSSMQLSGQPKDPTITTANIGIPGDAGSSTSLINWNNNVYAGFGANAVGLVQYGYQSNSTGPAPIYLDQVVGSDFVQFVVQANLVTLIINSLPSGIPYSDVGIQQLVNNFNGSLNQAVAQGVIQPFNNSNISYLTYSQVPTVDVGNRIYRNLSFTGNFLSRIQRIAVSISLSL